MKGWITTRPISDGSRRYDAYHRAGSETICKTFPKRRDADRYLAEMVKKIYDGTWRSITPVLFGDYAERWGQGLGGLKPSTIKDYRSVLRHALIPMFGTDRLDSIRVDDLNAFLALHQDTTSPRTRQKYLAILHRLFEDALAAGHLTRSPFADTRALRRPKALTPDEDRDVDVLDVAEITRLLDAVDPHYLPLFLTLVGSGLRLGEALGLEFGDIDWQARQLRIRRTYWLGQLLVPKTRKSRRTVDIGDQVAGALRGLQNGTTASTAVFRTPSGTRIDSNNLRNRVWDPALIRADLRHVRIHSLRHTYASLLISQNESLKYVADQLGHSSIQVTVDTYGHLLPSTKRQASDRLEAQLNLSGQWGIPSSIHLANHPEPDQSTGNTVSE